MTAVLLDTHAFLWWMADDPRLGPRAQAAVGSPESVVCVSAASAWEIAIKASLGKLRLPGDDIATAVEAAGFDALPVTFEHARVAGALPPHHRDPFDRMLVAQARVEGLALVTADGRLKRYGVRVLPAGA